jgi:hypothetical protein
LAIVTLSNDGFVKVHNTSSAPVDFYLSAQGSFFSTDKQIVVFGDVSGTGAPPAVGSTISAASLADLGVDVADMPTGSAAIIDTDTDPVSDDDTANVMPDESEENGADPGYVPDDDDSSEPGDTAPEPLADQQSKVASAISPSGRSSIGTYSGPPRIMDIFNRKAHGGGITKWVVRYGSNVTWHGHDGEDHKPFGWKKAWINHNMVMRIIKMGIQHGHHSPSGASEKFELPVTEYSCPKGVTPPSSRCTVLDERTIRIIYSEYTNSAIFGDHIVKGVTNGYCVGGDAWCPDWVKRAIYVP